MSPRVEFHESAELELNEAADFYDITDPGLGGAFLDEVERGLDQIIKHPEAAAQAHGAVRKRILARFPCVGFPQPLTPLSISILASES